MKFFNKNGHILVDIDGATYVVDTGSPLSFSFTKKDSIIINDNKYGLKDPETYGIKQNVIEWIVDYPVGGIIGNDIIVKTNLTINYFNNEIFFDVVEDRNCREVKGFPIKYVNGYIFANYGLEINGIAVERAVIDTGAIISFVSNKFIGENKKSYVHYFDKTDDRQYIYGPAYLAYRLLRCDPAFPTSFGPILVGVIEDNKSVEKKASALGIDAIIGTKDLGSMGNIIFNFTYNQPELTIFVDQGILVPKETIEIELGLNKK